MNSCLLVCAVAIVTLTIRVVIIRRLPKEQLARLNAITCPVCRVNETTIAVITTLLNVRKTVKLDRRNGEVRPARLKKLVVGHGRQL